MKLPALATLLLPLCIFGAAATDQLPLFAEAAPDPVSEGVLSALRETDPDDTTPRQAHALLAELRARLRGGEP